MSSCNLASIVPILDNVHISRIDAVPTQFLLRIGFVSILLRNINRSNSAPLKKVERSDFGIHFAKCEQHETEQGSGKNKIFQVKVLFLKLSNYKNLVSITLVILDIVDICFLYN